MKIKFVNIDKKKLERMKKAIELLLDFDGKEMEFTEENFKKAMSVKLLINEVKREARSDSDTFIKIVNPGGTGFTI